jgi:hypothetical protein
MVIQSVSDWGYFLISDIIEIIIYFFQFFIFMVIDYLFKRIVEAVWPETSPEIDQTDLDHDFIKRMTTGYITRDDVARIRQNLLHEEK